MVSYECNIDENKLLMASSAFILCFFAAFFSLGNRDKCFINKSQKDVPMILEEYSKESCSKSVNRKTKKLLYRTDSNPKEDLQKYNLDNLKVCCLTSNVIPIEDRDTRVYYTLDWIDAIRWLNNTDFLEIEELD